MKFLAALLLAAAAAHAAHAQPANNPQKVLRLAFVSAETGFDPAKIVDTYSRTITPHIFEGLYTYDQLARPVKFEPLTADGMPEVSADFRTWTVRIKPGIYFASDPAFKGQRRELVAQDYVYAFKRIADPANRSPVVAGLIETGFVGMRALRQEALDQKKPFDYDRPIEGLRALDRYTIQFKTEEPRPRLIETLAAGDLYGAVAREVVEHYGDTIVEHPVGTGPFKLVQWRRSSLIVLERNPDFREMRYDAEPGPEDTEGQAILARLKGRRLPMIDRVEVSIIEEGQPRWLAFLNGQVDALVTSASGMPGEFANLAMPNGKIAPHLAKKGIVGIRQVNADQSLTYYNMEDPVVGGYTPEKVALRRAFSLATDIEREIRVIRRGQAIPAQAPVSPHTTGYDPHFKSEMSDYDPARARALLDLYGYVDRDGDGYREQPDGSPLVLEITTQPEQIYRQFDEVRRKNMEAIGIRTRFNIQQFAETLKLARTGKLMTWSLGSTAAAPDGQQALQRWYGPQAGSQNLARFKLPAFDAIYQRMSSLPDGPEREALFREAKLLAVAYMPYKVNTHRISNDLVHPWLIGYRRPLFFNDWWHMVDIDESKRQEQ
jgi:ABC-type transport system substrate-binding protein